MEELKTLCGRDVKIFINGRQLLQAENAEVREIVHIHKIRSCFLNSDFAHLKGKPEYKAIFFIFYFINPFDNFNFHYIENFTFYI